MDVTISKYKSTVALTDGCEHSNAGSELGRFGDCSGDGDVTTPFRSSGGFCFGELIRSLRVETLGVIETFRGLPLDFFFLCSAESQPELALSSFSAPEREGVGEDGAEEQGVTVVDGGCRGERRSSSKPAELADRLRPGTFSRTPSFAFLAVEKL